MIYYKPGKWSVVFACSLRGSVFPKAFVWAAPCSLLSLILHTYIPERGGVSAGDVGASVLSGFTFILGFLVVFRSQQAYSRWWEGGTLLQQLRGEWFNAYSSLMAFCNQAPDKQEEVSSFQHRLVRLCSLLYCTAIQQVSTMKSKNYELIDLHDFDPESMKYLIGSHDRCEVCLQWIQRLILEASDAQTIKIAPPILSRVYNQLGNGIVNLNNARKIADFPIPFPLAQMITFMLLCHWLITALVCAASVEHAPWAVILSFIVTFSFWSINYIAVELEQPFGDDPNDLPLNEMQTDMNASLVALLDSRAQYPPKFTFGQHHLCLARSREDIEDTFGNGRQNQEEKSMGLMLRKLSMRSNDSPPSQASANGVRPQVDEIAAAAPAGFSNAPAGLMVFSCADDHNMVGSWPRPQVDNEIAAAAPTGFSPNVHHYAEPPLTPASTERRGRSGQKGHSMLSESLSTRCYQEYPSKDRPVPAHPRKHAERVVITTESVSSVPCPAAPGHFDCRHLAGKDLVIQGSWDTVSRETMAVQTQEARPNGGLGFVGRQLSEHPAQPPAN